MMVSAVNPLLGLSMHSKASLGRWPPLKGPTGFEKIMPIYDKSTISTSLDRMAGSDGTLL